MSVHVHSPQFFRQLLDVLTVGECRSTTAHAFAGSAPDDAALRLAVWDALYGAACAQSDAYARRYAEPVSERCGLSRRVPTVGVRVAGPVWIHATGSPVHNDATAAFVGLFLRIHHDF